MIDSKCKRLAVNEEKKFKGSKVDQTERKK